MDRPFLQSAGNLSVVRLVVDSNVLQHSVKVIENAKFSMNHVHITTLKGA
jgi:hypothetical protein